MSDDEANVIRRPSNLDRDAKLSYQAQLLSKKRVKEKITRLNSSVYRGARLTASQDYDFSESSAEQLDEQEDIVRDITNETEIIKEREKAKERETIEEQPKKGKHEYTNNAFEKDESPRVDPIQIETTSKRAVKVKEKKSNDKESSENTKEDKKKSVKFKKAPTPEPYVDSDEPSSNEDEYQIDLSILELLNTDMIKFVLTPVSVGLFIKCVIYRQKGFYPEYKMCLQKEDGTLVSLLSAKKYNKTKTPSYLIKVFTCDPQSSKQEQLAKVKSNVLGTQFTLYDLGVNPDKSQREKDEISGKLRCEYLTVLYDVNVLGLKGPRHMIIVIPGIDENGVPKEIRPTIESETMIAKWRRIENEMNSIRRNFKRQSSANINEEEEDQVAKVEISTENIIKLENKKPVWNAELRSYALNFNGRVTVPSVKNFQIVHSQHAEYIIQQFGKVNQDMYTCDFSYPLNALQAFGVAITSLDNKLACD
jgi:tubby and related proteins